MRGTISKWVESRVLAGAVHSVATPQCAEVTALVRSADRDANGAMVAQRRKLLEWRDANTVESVNPAGWDVAVIDVKRRIAMRLEIVGRRTGQALARWKSGERAAVAMTATPYFFSPNHTTSDSAAEGRGASARTTIGIERGKGGALRSQRTASAVPRDHAHRTVSILLTSSVGQGIQPPRLVT